MGVIRALAPAETSRTPPVRRHPGSVPARGWDGVGGAG